MYPPPPAHILEGAIRDAHSEQVLMSSGHEVTAGQLLACVFLGTSCLVGAGHPSDCWESPVAGDRAAGEPLLNGSKQQRKSAFHQIPGGRAPPPHPGPAQIYLVVIFGFVFFPRPGPGPRPSLLFVTAWSAPRSRAAGGTGVAWVGAVLFIGVLFSKGRVMKRPPEVLPSWALVVSLSPELQPPQEVSFCGDLPLPVCTESLESSVLLLMLGRMQNGQFRPGVDFPRGYGKDRSSPTSRCVSAARWAWPGALAFWRTVNTDLLPQDSSGCV